jgi:hypothetical protein
MKTSRAFGLGAILALGLAAASCGSDDEPPSGGGRGGRGGTTGRGGTAGAAGSSGAAGTAAGRGGASGTGATGGAAGTAGRGGTAGTGGTVGTGGTAGTAGTAGTGGTAGVDAGDAAGGTAGDAAGGTAGADASDASGGTSGNDASPDTGTDTGADVTVDTGADVAVDTGADTGSDSGDAAVTSPVVINEIESNPDDWVELYNTSSAAVDISGWLIRDSTTEVGYTFPANTTLAANAYVAVDVTVGLGGTDSVRVFNSSGTLVASQGWTGHAAGFLARCPNGTGTFVDLSNATRGAANSNCP